jgi:homeobox protein ESX1
MVVHDWAVVVCVPVAAVVVAGPAPLGDDPDDEDVPDAPVDPESSTPVSPPDPPVAPLDPWPAPAIELEDPLDPPVLPPTEPGFTEPEPLAAPLELRPLPETEPAGCPRAVRDVEEWDGTALHTSRATRTAALSAAPTRRPADARRNQMRNCRNGVTADQACGFASDPPVLPRDL